MTSENGTTLHLDIAGLSQEVHLTPQEQATVIDPTINRLIELYTPGQRKTAFLAGPPGSGKSTFAAIIEHGMPDDIPFQVLPADGFHYPNSYLDSHTIVRDGVKIALRQVKGAPETFDAQKLAEKLRQLKAGEPIRWPIYDRKLHDPVDDAIEIPPEGVFLIEGNYLLLNKQPWDSLHAYADLTMFLVKSFEQLRQDIIARHMKGKSWDYERAAAFFETSDGRNAQLIINSQIERPDLLISVSDGNRYTGITI